jgi:putative methyltransferase (TIGR04325 family)
VLLSSVIQYLPDPYAFINDLVARRFDHIIVDRTAFLREGRDRLTIEHVPEWIYPAAYPAWFLSESRFLATFDGQYECIAAFDALDTTQPDGGDTADYKGFLFDLRDTR